jgi:large subunit ribosomal protein L24
MAARIRTGDEVVVISGKDKGKRGRVLRVIREKSRVVVEGINVVTRHLRRNPQNPQAGGRIQRPAPMHISKVMPWSASDNKGVRVKFQGEGRGKQRLATKSGAVLAGHGKGKARATKGG